MAGTSADKLNLLKATKADLKAALVEKGQTPGDVFSAYPGMVRAIDTQEDLSAEMTTQDSIIAQIATALESKATPAPVSEYVEVAVKGSRRYSYVDENKQVQSVWGGEDVTIRAYKGVVVNEGGSMSNAIGDLIRVYADEVYIFLSDGGVLEPD